MTRAKISEYSATANDNTDVNGVDIAEGCPPSSMNNMGREIMAALKRFQVGSDGDGVTVGGALVVSGATTLTTVSATVVQSDTVSEKTSAAGVTVDGVLLKDSQVTTDQINEKTSATGVTIDGVLLKDSGVVTGAGTVSAPVYSTTGDLNTGIFFPAADTIAFAEGGAEAMRITSDGRLGIGTSSPAQPLEIASATGGTIGLRYIGNSGYATVGTDGSSQILFSIGNPPSERMRITSGGEVYIAGTTDRGAYNLQCNGTGVWGAGAYVNGSDERIKEEIEPIASGLDVIEKLNPVTYRYKESWTKDQTTQTGFIAQELLTALNGQVYVDGVVQQGGSDGYYSVAYQNIIPILTKAIQELSAKNDALEARIAALEAQA